MPPMGMPSLRKVKIKDIEGAEWNPPDREKKAIKALAESIEKYSFLGAIILKRSEKPPYKLIDGHRRTAAMRLLQQTEIPAIFTDAPAGEVYASINSTSKPMGGRDILYIFFHNQDALTPRQRKGALEAESVLGTELLRRMSDEGLTIHSFGIAKDIAKYCALDKGGEFIVRVVQWLCQWKQQNLTRQAMKDNIPPVTIEKAIELMQPLSLHHNYGVVSEDDEEVA